MGADPTLRRVDRHALLAGAGLAPFAAGAALGPDGSGLPCPFRAVTGLPCPLCGASRAFGLVARGDGDWVRYGAVWVVVAAVTVLAALLRWRPPWHALPAAAAVAWAWALAHAGTITGSAA